MTCGDVDLALMNRGAWTAEAKAHLRGCGRCESLARVLALRAAERPSAETMRRIEEQLTPGLLPVRPLKPASYFFAAFAGIFVLVAGLSVYRIGAFALAVMTPLQAGAILLALAASSGLLVYSLVCQMAPGSRHRVSPKLLPAVVIVSLAVAMAALFQFHHQQDFGASGWACFRAGTPVGLLAAVPFWLLLRRGTILSPGMTGTATGLLAGLVGTSVLEIHCPDLDARHILFSHLGVAVAGAAGGLVTGLAVDLFERLEWRA